MAAENAVMAGALSMLAGPAGAGGVPIPSLTATSRSDGRNVGDAAFVNSSPFVVGDGNAVAPDPAGAVAVQSGVGKIADMLGPAATIATLAVSLIVLIKLLKS